MLTLRKPQMEALTAAVWNRFSDDAGLLLGQHCAEWLQNQTPAEQQRCIRRALDLAWAQGLRRGTSLILFAACVLEYGPSFDRHPVVHGFLSLPGLDPDARVQRLVDSLPLRVWDELGLLAAPPQAQATVGPAERPHGQ